MQIPEVHEVLGRELDPIDDIRRRLENSYTQDYFNPANGDWISDDYWRTIELTTQPGELNSDEVKELDGTISRLNGKYNLIQRRLGNSSLLGAYVDVAEQVTDLNEDLPVAAMQAAPREALPAINTLIAESEMLNITGWKVLIGWPNPGSFLSSDGYFDAAAKRLHEADELANVSGAMTQHS